MENLGIIELKKEKARDYTPFFLKGNPFPAVGIPGDTILFTVDREPVIKSFQNVIGEFLNTEASIITVLIGDYGSGKSHLLKLFKHSVNTQLLSQENGTIAVYIKSPGEDFRDFFLEFIINIDWPLFVENSEEVIRKYIEKHKPEVANLIVESNIKKSFLESKLNLGAFLKNSKFLELFRRIKEDEFHEVHSNDLVFAFLMLSHPDYSSKAWRWFLGGHLDRKEKEEVHVEILIEDDVKAYSIFGDLVKLLQIVGIKSFVILIDELEKITQIETRKKTKYQEKLRQMIDDYPKDLCIYFAIAPHQWGLLTKEPTALARRLAGNWITLGGFEKDYTRELIEKYLFYSRVDKFSSKDAKAKYNDCEPSLCPFTLDSIDAIQKASKGLVSNIILLCRKSLEYFHDNQTNYHSITQQLIESVKKQEGLS